MNLLFDLKEILYDNHDNEHEMRVSVDKYEVRVELIYDPDRSPKYGEEETILTIVYTPFNQFAYVPDDEYRKKYNVADFGINILEAKLIYDIMSYLELHGEEISDLCYSLSLQNGERYRRNVKIETPNEDEE